MGAFSNLIPLIVLFVVIGGGGYIGYQIYLWSNQLTDRGIKHMEKKNMSFTKDGGLKVGVKEMKGEAYEDKTQNVLVNVWNTSQGRPSTLTPRTSSSHAKPPSTSRTTSSTSTSGAAAANVSPPTQRTTSSNSIPGGW